MSDSLGLRRKRTATERAESNADPLVIRKKARKAAKSNMTATVSTEINRGSIHTRELENGVNLLHAMAPANKGPKVSLCCF